MPLPIMQVPQYPNVPALPGVPALNRIASVANPVVLLAANIVRILRFFQGPQWGIFTEKGDPLLIGDSVVAVDYKREAAMPSYPIENGSFGQYNKVQIPFDARVVFAIGGSDRARAEFLARCQKLVAGLDIVSLVTPEVTYPKAQVLAYNYRRTAQDGATLPKVEVVMQEMRFTPKAAFTAAAQPSGADPEANGTVQAAPPTAAQDIVGKTAASAKVEGVA